MNVSIATVKSIISLCTLLEQDIPNKLMFCSQLMKSIEELFDILREVEYNLYIDCLECKSYSQVRELLEDWYCTLDDNE